MEETSANKRCPVCNGSGVHWEYETSNDPNSLVLCYPCTPCAEKAATPQGILASKLEKAYLDPSSWPTILKETHKFLGLDNLFKYLDTINLLGIDPNQWSYWEDVHPPHPKLGKPLGELLAELVRNHK